MSALTIWTNHDLRPAAAALLQEGVAAAGARLVQSAHSTREVLLAGGDDPALAEADVAYGQPDPGAVARLGRLRWVALSTAGYTRYDRADLRAALRARGAVMTNASAVFANPCAEHALAMMLAQARELPKYVRNGAGPRGWPYLEGRYTIETLTGKTVVLLGYGAIGRRLAELLAPFRGRVVAVRRTVRGDEGVETVTEAEVGAVLGAADHVVNLLPDGPGTRHFCNAAFFARMKPGAFFCNVGRGTTVDQAALLAALQGGRLGGAWLDALDPEPLPPDHPLWAEPRCQITPHVAGGHAEQDENLVRHFLDNLGRFRRGEPLQDRIA